MGITVTDTEAGCRIAFEGEICCAHARAYEDQLIDAMRRYRHLAIDLSAIRGIDRCGLQLLSLLQKLGGRNAVVVADSPVVQQARQRLLRIAADGVPRGSSERPAPRRGSAGASNAAHR